jgi:hypothetical protein
VRLAERRHAKQRAEGAAHGAQCTLSSWPRGPC